MQQQEQIKPSDDMVVRIPRYDSMQVLHVFILEKASIRVQNVLEIWARDWY
jgi:hypothetical protein